MKINILFSLVVSSLTLSGVVANKEKVITGSMERKHVVKDPLERYNITKPKISDL